MSPQHPLPKVRRSFTASSIIPSASLLLTAVLLLTPSAKAEPQSLVFKNHGKLVATFTLDELKKQLPATELTVLEPHLTQDRTYQGFTFNALMNKVYGPNWKKSEEVLFTCADGYQPSVPLSEFRERHAHLAFSIASGEPFKVANHEQNNHQVDLGPFYLTWDNRNDDVLKAEGGTYWPYQVVGVDLITFADHFPKIAPPKNSNADVSAGFVGFRKHCMSCHSINGEGGTAARIDLNSPVNVTEYYQASFLPKWLADPASIRPLTTMPAVPKNLPHRDQIILNIIAYLKAMKSKKL